MQYTVHELLCLTSAAFNLHWLVQSGGSVKLTWFTNSVAYVLHIVCLHFKTIRFFAIQHTTLLKLPDSGNSPHIFLGAFRFDFWICSLSICFKATGWFLYCMVSSFVLIWASAPFWQNILLSGSGHCGISMNRAAGEEAIFKKQFSNYF